MGQDLKRRVIGTFGFLSILLFWGIILIPIIVQGKVGYPFYWGGLAGLFGGFLSWVHLARTWDPVHLRPIKSESKNGGRLITIGVISGTAFARIVSGFSEAAKEFFIATGVVGFTLFAGHMIFQIWWNYSGGNDSG
jgi:hypothetical protein